jgi:hypothetical protein
MNKKNYAEYLINLSETLYSSGYKMLDTAKKELFESGSFNNINWLGYYCSVETALFLNSKDEKHLINAKNTLKILCDIQEEYAALNGKIELKKSDNIFLEALKDSGFKTDLRRMPVLETIFTFGPTIKAIKFLKDAGQLSTEEINGLEKLCEIQVVSILPESEWGAHNRCVLRAIIYYIFSDVFPQNKHSEKCRQLAKRLFEQSIGRWSIEDAAMYQPIWLTCVTEYVYMTGYWDSSIEVILSYYAHFFLNLIMPNGGLPEFGDGHWDAGWASTLVLGTSEFMAAKQRSGILKYGASRIAEHFIVDNKREHGAASERGFVNALLLCDDTVKEEQPQNLSGEILDELVGKKIVLKTGWNSKDTYLLYNYRDEGLYGKMGRDYLRKSIPVHAEKAHHGHADEQAILALWSNRKVFLRDGGYRDSFTTDGHYRADFYHNRMIIRRGRIFNEIGLLDYAKNIGTYQKVTTEKLFFERFSFGDALRTRLYDNFNKCECDRTIVFLKEENIFIVIDNVKALETGEYTLGPIFFGKEVERINESEFRVYEDENYYNSIDKSKELESLRAVFLRKDCKGNMEEIRRNYRNEQSFYQYSSRYFKQNEVFTFVTLLIPETFNTPQERESSISRASYIASNTKFYKTGMGYCTGVEIATGTGKYFIGSKDDLDYGIGDLNIRPAYAYESGKADYGLFQTDASFFIAQEKVENNKYFFVEGTKVIYKNMELFSVPTYNHLQLDFTRKPGVWSWGSYEDIY